MGITNAMPSGCSLEYDEESASRSRPLTWVIAEQHAVTLSEGLENTGAYPFCANLFQFDAKKAYDQADHDVV